MAFYKFYTPVYSYFEAAMGSSQNENDQSRNSNSGLRSLSNGPGGESMGGPNDLPPKEKTFPAGELETQCTGRSNRNVPLALQIVD